MSWWTFLFISCISISRSSCDKSSVNINQVYCADMHDDSLCEEQVCGERRRILLPSIVRNNFSGGTGWIWNVCCTRHHVYEYENGYSLAAEQIFDFFLSFFRVECATPILLSLSRSFFEGRGFYFFLLLVFLFSSFPSLPLRGRHNGDARINNNE